MGFAGQTWTLTKKNLLIVFGRHWLSTTIRAFLAPIIFMFFISYAKNFFVPPSDFGIGSPTPVRTFADALGTSAGGRNIVAFVNNGITGDDVQSVITNLSDTVTAQGKTAITLNNDNELLDVCRSSIRGVSKCFAGISFQSSPSQGGIWNYTIRADGSFGSRIFVNSKSNDAEIYVLPLQHAVDSAIASSNGTSLPLPEEYPFTSQTSEERQRNITRLYMGSLISILAVAYFIGVVGVCYQLTGQMAQERELGMSQLIEAMMPNKRRWEPQAIRLISNHLSFDILYLPSWVIMGAVVARLNYPISSTGIMIGFFILAGLSLSSWSIAFASLFRKAQLSGITVTIVSIVLAIIVQVQQPQSTGGAAILALLFPPMNYTLFIIYMAHWQQVNEAAQLSQSAPNAPWRIPGYVFFIFLAIQFVVYPMLGAVIERTLYGTASKARNMHTKEEGSRSDTVKIEGLSKHYPPSWFRRNILSRFSKSQPEKVVAVDELNLTMRHGQIHVLLGANGSGKSTTMDMLAGLQKPTAGSMDVFTSRGVSICPQKNVLWDELTCEEHVKIFNRLKATSADSKDEIKNLISACDLDLKIKARSETLSGGQKRKLQLAMMLTGGSDLCLLDEVSSGLDPLSRRKIFDILIAQRGQRTLLVTTHFLDEADLLADHITMLSKGKLVADGSAVELKHLHGGGYRVKIYAENDFREPQEWANLSKRVHSDHTVYQMTTSAEAAEFVARLEQLGVSEYRVSGPTIEDVFLKMATEVKEQSGDQTKSTPLTNVTSIASQEKGLELAYGGKTSMVAQTRVLFRKRLTILRRNYLPYLAALVIPIITAGLVTFFLKNFTQLTCSPEAQSTVSDAISLSSLTYLANMPVGPPSSVPVETLSLLYPELNNSFTTVQTLDAFNAYIATNYSITTPGGFFLGAGNPTFAYRGNYELSFAILVQNLMDNSLLRSSPIATAYQAFATPWAPGAGDSLQFILYFGLAMSAYPGFFALYPTSERLNRVRALHWSNGVRAFPLWLAYTLFDFCFVLVISAIAVIIFVSVSSALYYPGWLFLVFFLYGLAALLCSYVVSLFVTSQLAAFAFAAGMQCVMFLIYFIAYMCIITYSAAADVNRYVDIAHFTIALFTPSGNLLRSLLLTFNEFSLLCDDRSVASYAGAITVYGGPILYLIVQTILLMLFLIWWDSGWKPAFLVKVAHKHKDVEQTEDVDHEVFTEAARIDSCTDELRVSHVTKVYGDNLAVDDITFGVPHGEVFALLGPNGAGKSTTISMVRGDIRPTLSEGDIMIEEQSIVRHRAAARNHLGVVPQFDAMDAMTTTEHLRFYARARGVKNVEHNVEQVLNAVGLASYRNRMAAKLSGGNKRKLSLGIALIGNPSVLLVDEGSSGMDAAAKRIMWRTLSSVSAGRSLVLTTHSMEEADALADRVGIMAKRMLALGTSDTLRKRHGDAYYVHLIHKDAPFTSEEDMASLKAWILSTFPYASVEERSFHGQIRFSVPNRASSPPPDYSSSSDKKDATTTVISTEHGYSGRDGISALFEALEVNKEKLGMEFYAVSQATLDQVFLNIVTKHNVEEENYRQEHQTKLGAWGKFKAGAKRLYHDA